MFDLLIKGGRILDGTGNPGFDGTLGIAGDKVTIIRGDDSRLEGQRTLDAAGKVVCPGFIDVHAHSGLVILAEPKHEAKVSQGITTELVGIDGNSYAPFRSEEDLYRFIQLNSGLDGDPPLPGIWSSVAEYLAMFDRKVAVNIAYIVGNAPIRINAVGWNDRPATPAEMEDMKALVRESMGDGACGMSTGLDYPPGSFADTDELVTLSTEVARLGGIYHTHVRNWLGDRYLDPCREAVDIGRRSGVPIHITHLFRRKTHPGGARPILDLVDEAREDSMDITFDMFPYRYGGTRIIITFPHWAQDGGPDKLKEVIRSEEGRERLRREVTPRGRGWDEMWVTYFKQPHNRRFEGRSVAEVADMVGKNPVDAICDLLLDEDLRVSYYADIADESSLPDFIAHPLYMVGTDALLLGDYPPPMAYGTFPHILSTIVREERKILLQDAVRKMTSFPAQRLGLIDRGVLRDGMKADVVVFDAGTITANATKQNPKQFPSGIDYVIVNGTVVMDHGQHTGALPGQALRRGVAA
jgi:N-acyl-D-amino-acid deacylase